MEKELFVPELTGNLRKQFLKMPDSISKASGIRIFGKTVRSILYSTDVAIIKNTNADAVIAVYPFTPQPAITEAILLASDIPVLCGVGGGLTHGIRSADVALHAEFQGAFGVVLNAPSPNRTISQVNKRVDVPVIITVVSELTDIQEKLDAGASVINVSGGSKTPLIVENIRERYPYLPIIATGGQTEESVMATIKAGANAITYTPPTNAEIFKERMVLYREQENIKHQSDQ